MLQPNGIVGLLSINMISQLNWNLNTNLTLHCSKKSQIASS